MPQPQDMESTPLILGNLLSDEPQNHANWHSVLPDKSIHITQLHQPSTHNSAISTIRLDKSPDCEQHKKFNTLKILSFLPFVKALIEKWTCTQEKTIYEQLMAGIRNFDLRFLYNPNDQSFWISHSYASCPLLEPFQQFKDFLEQYPDEILTVKLTIDYEHTQKTKPHVQTAYQLIHDLMHEHLIPAGDLQANQYSVANIQKTPKQRIFFSMHYFKLENNALVPEDLDLNEHLIWPTRYFKDYWPNQDSPAKVEQYLKSHQSDISQNELGKFKQFSAIVTPTGGSITQSFFSSSLNFFKNFGLKPDATETNQLILKDFEENQALTEGSPQVSFDFPSDETINRIIQMNK